MTTLLVIKGQPKKCIVIEGQRYNVSPGERLFNLIGASEELVREFIDRARKFQRETRNSVIGLIDRRTLWRLCQKHRLRVS